MSKQNWKQEIDGYVKNVPFAALAYVRSDGTPVQRTLGSFARHDINLFFSTRIDAFLFEADNQQLPAWKNVLFIGKAAPVTGDSELKLATELLSARNPRFKERVSKDGLKDTQVFRLQTEEIQFLDFAKGQGHLQKISLPEREEV
jgi:hypothetical protein